MNIDVVNLVASAAVSAAGTGLLGNWLLQKDRAAHEKVLADERSTHERSLAQIESKLESEIRVLQTRLDRTVLVTRVQFETEFKAMQDIWKAMIETRGTMAVLRPEFDTVPANQTALEKRETLRIRFVAFAKALGEAKDALFHNEPFISTELFNELFNGFIAAAQAEHLAVRLHKEETDPQWYENGAKNVGNACASLNRAGLIIRQRLQTLTVV